MRRSFDEPYQISLRKSIHKNNYYHYDPADTYKHKGKRKKFKLIELHMCKEPQTKAKQTQPPSYRQIATEVVKGNWTEEEDQLVTKLVEKYGPQKWSIIAD